MIDSDSNTFPQQRRRKHRANTLGSERSSCQETPYRLLLQIMNMDKSDDQPRLGPSGLPVHRRSCSGAGLGIVP